MKRCVREFRFTNTSLHDFNSIGIHENIVNDLANNDPAAKVQKTSKPYTVQIYIRKKHYHRTRLKKHVHCFFIARLPEVDYV